MTEPRSDTRARILACIRRFPGIHLRGIERELDVSSALVHYHLKALEAAGDVVSAAIGGYLRFFPKDVGEGRRPLTPEDATLLALLREEIPLHVVLLIVEKGPTSQAELVDALGLAKSTVSYHVDRLATRGLLERVERAGGERVLRVREPARVRRLLLQYTPTNDLMARFKGLWEDFYGR